MELNCFSDLISCRKYSSNAFKYLAFHQRSRSSSVSLSLAAANTIYFATSLKDYLIAASKQQQNNKITKTNSGTNVPCSSSSRRSISQEAATANSKKNKPQKLNRNKPQSAKSSTHWRATGQARPGCATLTATARATATATANVDVDADADTRLCQLHFDSANEPQTPAQKS